MFNKECICLVKGHLAQEISLLLHHTKNMCSFHQIEPLDLVLGQTNAVCTTSYFFKTRLNINVPI